MKKITVFGILMLFLVGLVSAIDLTIESPNPDTVDENTNAIIEMITDGNATFSASTPAEGTLTKDTSVSNKTYAKYT